MRPGALAVIAAVGLVSAAGAWADDPPAKPNGGDAAAKTGENRAPNAPPAFGAPGMMGANWYIGYVGRIVKLTDDQKKAMTEIIKARDRAIKDFQTQNAENIKAAGRAVRESLTTRDRDAIAKSQRAYLLLFAPMHQLMKDSQTDLNNVLTDPQKDQLHEYHVMRAIKSMVAPVTLTTEQIEQVKAASKGDDLGVIGGKIYQAIQQVLTPEQKTAIAKSRAMNYAKFAFGRAKLSADQLKQVEALCDELAKDQTNPLDRGRGYAKLTEKINELLTDGQKETLKKARKSWWGPGGIAPRSSTPATPGNDGSMEMPEDQGADLID